MAEKYAYELTFPNVPEGRVSLVHLKRLVLIGVSHYLYRRNVFPMSCFKERRIEGARYMVVDKNGAKGELFYRYMNGIGNALKNKYLRKLIVHLCPIEDRTGTEAVEVVTFNFCYDVLSETLAVTDLKGDRLSAVRYSGPASTREQVLGLLKKINEYTRNPSKFLLQCHPVIRMELYDETASQDYVPPAFVETDTRFCISASSEEKCLGFANFQEHACKVTVDSTCHNNADVEYVLERKAHPNDQSTAFFSDVNETSVTDAPLIMRSFESSTMNSDLTMG